MRSVIEQLSVTQSSPCCSGVAALKLQMVVRYGSLGICVVNAVQWRRCSNPQLSERHTRLAPGNGCGSCCLYLHAVICETMQGSLEQLIYCANIVMQ